MLLRGVPEVVADDTGDAGPAIRAALSALDRDVGGIVELLPGKYFVGSPIEIPHDFRSSATVVIRGYGARLRADGAFPIIRRVPVDQTEALDTMVPTSVVIEGLCGEGSGVAGQTFINLGATFNARIIACHAVGFDIGFDLRFCLNARVESCRATLCKTYGFVARTGDWENADGFNSQSNHTQFVQCRNYASDGMLAGFYILGTNGVVLDHCIAEGHNPVHNVVFDYGGTGVTRHFAVRNLHCENTPTRSHVYIKAAGTVDLDGIWVQTGGPIVEWGLAQHFTYVRNIPWIATERPFECADAGAGFTVFENVGLGIDCTQAGRWVGDRVPSNLRAA